MQVVGDFISLDTGERGRVTLEEADPCRFLPPGTAPVPGEDPCEQ